MDIEAILKERDWVLVPRQDWIAVQDPRPEFAKVFPKGRVGKLMGATFYVTLKPLSSVTSALIGETGATLQCVKSRDARQDAEYLGFDTATVSEEKLRTFFQKLSGTIDDLL